MQRLITSRALKFCKSKGCITKNYSTKVGSISKKDDISQILKDVETSFADSTEPVVLGNSIEAIRKIIPKDLKEFEPVTITIGVVQSPNMKPGLFMDTILTDPFSSKSKDFIPTIKKFRESNQNKNIRFVYGNENQTPLSQICEIKSPILNSELRLIQDIKTDDGKSKEVNRNIFNDLSFIEVNDIKFLKNDENTINGSMKIDLSTEVKDSNIKESDIQLWIYVRSSTSDLTVTKINTLPHFDIIDQSIDISYLSENFAKNEFQVDLEKLNHANGLLIADMQNISQYLELYKKSNISELLFALNKETSGYKPLILNIRNLIKYLSDNKIEAYNEIHIEELKEEISGWSQLSHYELQSKVAPFLDLVLKKELTKINQLVLNSGDLSILIKNLLNSTDKNTKIKKGIFQKEVGLYGSLKDSANKGHYLEGKIDSIINNKQDLNDSIDNYTIELNNKIINRELVQLQERINKVLINEIVSKPFVVFLTCNIGYIYDFISLNTGVSIIALSLALAINHSQKKVIKLIDQFNNNYLDELRLFINKTGKYLSGKLQNNVDLYETKLRKQDECVEDLQKILAQLEDIDKNLDK